MTKLRAMARPLRIEYPGALYHVTSRGDRREAIYEDDEDRRNFLRILAEVISRFRWLCHAYCLMPNHYHLVVETPEGNLSKGMRQLNGMYTQASNRRHQRVGHLFQGRFKGILVDQDSYLLELARYVVLNPVRAGLVKRQEAYLWSSYRAMAGLSPTPVWLASDAILSQFGRRQADARRRYAKFVLEGTSNESVWTGLRQQIYLGDERFAERMRKRAKIQGDVSSIPRAQRRKPAPSLAAIAARHRQRDDAFVAAYGTGTYSYREIAGHFGVHLSTVGRVIRARLLQEET